MTRDRSLGTGAYYDQDDYAGIMRRIAVLLIDGSVLLPAVIGSWVMLSMSFWSLAPAYDPSGIHFLLTVLIVWLYLVPLKRSRYRTIAYRLLGIKIVTTKGERPSLFTMTFRMLMWLLGPFNLMLDLIWLGADTEGQSLRDCYAGTYVVRNGAEPIGFAPVHLTRYTAAGFALAYPRVCRPVSTISVTG